MRTIPAKTRNGTPTVATFEMKNKRRFVRLTPGFLVEDLEEFVDGCVPRLRGFVVGLAV